jgi:hypothetical protein
MTRIIILLIAIWSLVAGILLVFFHGTASGALGAGVSDAAGQRLVGAHLLILVPVYLMIAWHPERYESLLWLPFAGQLIILLSVGYGIVSGDTKFADGAMALAVSAIFVGLLSFIWISEQRAMARAKMEADESHMDWLDDQETSGDDDLDSPFGGGG